MRIERLKSIKGHIKHGGRWSKLRLIDQLINQAQGKAKEIDQLRHGEITFKVQDGRIVWGEIKTTWKADSNKREARA